MQSCGTTLVSCGSLILSTRAPIGSLAIAEVSLCTNQGCKSLVPYPCTFSRFYAYILAINQEELNIRGKGTTFLELSGDALGEFELPVPSLAEQRAITAFLDAETARIEALIAEYETLIELLKEKRQALISQAVTKGLNPDVPMKDSGVEWLGEVPEGWEVAPLKHIVSTPITDGPHETPTFYDEGIPFVSAEAVSSGFVDFTKIRGFISVEDNRKFSEKYKPARNDIYMVKSGATTGVTAIVEADDEFNIWSPLAVIRCNRDSSPRFVLNFMRSQNFQDAVTLNWSFGTQQNIGMSVIKQLSITRPPISEQHAIAAFLDAETSRMDALVQEAETGINLLRERRMTLISDAVTGKIDVRCVAKTGAPVFVTNNKGGTQ